MGGPAVDDYIADVDAFAAGTSLGASYTAAAGDAGSVELPVDRTIRWSKSLTYELRVPAAGMYDVHVASVELFHANVGERVFNVSVAVDGGAETLLATGVDLVRDVGRLVRATWRIGPTRIEGAVTVRLVGEVENACVSSIWMMPVVMLGDVDGSGAQAVSAMRVVA